MIHGTYVLGFSHLDFIHYIVNNSVVFLFLLESFPRYGVSPVILNRLLCSILSYKFAQDLTFIRRMASAVNHKGFRFGLG